MQKWNDFTVLVLMSTYNGELYLSEQLDSILNQEDVDVYLLVRDDGSKDSTCKILSDYSSRYTNIDWVSGDNVGFVKSFSALTKMALDYKITPNFYAFADQDDTWFPEKLRTACLALASKDKTKPHLFSCNSMRIDTNGHNIGLFHEGASPVYRRGNVLVYGTEQGCSMTFNRKAVEIYAAHEPQLTWHDRWMYHICYYLGSVTYEHQPLFNYRIHGNNTLAGETKHDIAPNESRIHHAIHLYFLGSPFTNHQEMAQEFMECFGDFLSESDRKLFKIYTSYRKNIFSKIQMLFSEEFHYPFSESYETYPFKRFVLFNLL